MRASRRGFLSGAAALALGGVCADVSPGGVASRTQELRLRIGILADTHLNTNAAATKKFKRALEAFRKRRVDGVLVCGDLADNGLVPQLEEFAWTWEEVFPRSKGLGGAHVERLFHYGDHDNRGVVSVPEDVLKHYGWTESERDANAITLHPKETWERIFDEPWSPIVHKRVKGYDFVLSHYTRELKNSALGLEGFLRDFRPDPRKPFFFSKHRVLRNTVCGPGSWGQDDGTVGRLISSYPNCCAFCGHSHYTAAREDSIWQGAFTAVQVPSLYGVTQEPGHSNKPNGCYAEQGMLLDVYDGKMVIHRIDFVNGKPIGPAWEIPLVCNSRPFAHEARRRTAVAPEFPAGTKLIAEIRQGGDDMAGKTLSLAFPVISGIGKSVRAYDYEVTVDALCFGGDTRRAVKRFFSPKCHFAPSAEPETMQIGIALNEFTKWNSLKSKNWGALHVEVRPREIFGGLGRAIEADVQS